MYEVRGYEKHEGGDIIFDLRESTLTLALTVVSNLWDPNPNPDRTPDRTPDSGCYISKSDS